MSSAYNRLAAIRDYWVTRDLSARAEVRVTDIAAVLHEVVRLSTVASARHAANVKLLGALDMIRESLHGGNVDDLLLIINTAIAEAHGIGGEE